MNTFKKVKTESKFNIIRELYLNNENRNILDELLNHIDRESRTIFILSMLKVDNVCNNCFNSKRSLKISSCTENLHLFCNECNIEHVDKHSKLTGVYKINHMELMNMRYSHFCDIGTRPYIYKNIDFRTFLKEYVDLNNDGLFIIDTKPSNVFLKE